MKFSIITCTCNSEKYISRCLESIESQNYFKDDFEHIFIDWNSNDSTILILKEYCTRNQNSKIFERDRRWISNAMNEWIKVAQGEYILHIHSDDRLHDENILRDLSDFLEKNSGLDWVYWKINIVEMDWFSVWTFPIRKIFQKGPHSLLKSYLLKYFNYIPHQAVAIKKDVFNRFWMFDETISSAMDPDLWLRIRTSTKWRFFDRIISDYTIRKWAQSSDKNNSRKNLADYILVQSRYLSKMETFFANIINKAIETSASKKVKR